MIEITSNFRLDESELEFDYARASGPGGENVNKVSTAVQLRFDVLNSQSLSPDVKARLVKLAGNRMTQAGQLIIIAKRFRTQEHNRTDAIQRLVSLIQKAAIEPKVRRRTRPSLTSSATRIDEKKKRGQTKRLRQDHPTEWE